MLRSLLDLGGDLLDRVIPDPEAKRDAKARLMDLHQQGDLQKMEARMRVIRTEAQSKDAWTSRARPTFMYVFYTVILSLVLLGPLVGVFAPSAMAIFFENVGAGFQAVPTEMWTVFTAGYLGYGGFRTVEKVRGVAK